MANPEYNPRQFWQSRDFHSSARLYFQHFLVQKNLGYVLHPSIPQENVHRVADVGCGNGQWLIEASNELPESTELTGFDIATHNFPAPEYVPANIKFAALDVMTGDCPSELLHKFDVVHIRFFSGIVTKNDPQPLISTITKLLKPGGWVQWEENDPSTLHVKTPRPDIDTTNSKNLLNFMLMAGKATGMDFDWLSKFETHFNMFKDVQVKHYPILPAYYKPWTENFLTVYEDVAQNVPPASQAAPNSPVTRESYLEMFDKVVQEVKAGAILCQKDIVTVLAH